jgi:hypothetical protein
VVDKPRTDEETISIEVPEPEQSLPSIGKSVVITGVLWDKGDERGVVIQSIVVDGNPYIKYFRIQSIFLTQVDGTLKQDKHFLIICPMLVCNHYL